MDLPIPGDTRNRVSAGRWLSMKSLWIILLTGLFVIAICSLILYSPVRVRAEYRHQEDDDAGQIELSFLWNLIRWRKKLIGVEVEPTKNGPAVTVHQRPAADATGSGHPPKAPGAATKARTDRLSVAAVLRNVPHWLAIMREARPKIQQLARRSHLDRLHIAAQLGTGDAVHTGILCGGLAATLYACAGWLTHQMGRSETPNITGKSVV